MKPVVNKEFRNETVKLDGKSFVDCRFINVRFLYNGTMPTQFSNCTRPAGEREYILQTDNPLVMTAHELIGALRASSG